MGRVSDTPTTDILSADTVDALRARVHDLMPQVRVDLEALARIPSVSLDAFDQAQVEASAEAEEAWVQEIVSSALQRAKFAEECTPGYYNNEGRDAGLGAKLNVGYPAGAAAYFTYLDGWRSSGDFEGLMFR